VNFQLSSAVERGYVNSKSGSGGSTARLTVDPCLLVGGQGFVVRGQCGGGRARRWPI